MYTLPIKTLFGIAGNNIDYCEFPANIVLSRSEQEERTKIYDKRVTTVQTQKE